MVQRMRTSVKPRQIKYMGQGGSTAPVGLAYQSQSASTFASPVMPAYSQPVSRSSEPENPRTKRIEFRYPDQPQIVHSSNRARGQGQGYQVHRNQPSVTLNNRSTMTVAAVNPTTPTTKQPTRAPILHQPAYKKPVIEETVMDDITPTIAIPSTKSAVYEPVAQTRFDSTGIASWYGEAYHGQPTANGEIFDMNALSAAHPTLPLPSLVQVKNLENGKEIVVRVNDRGPFVPDRMIDMSKGAANELGFLVSGEAKVSVRYLGPAPVATEIAGQGSPAPSHQPAPESKPQRTQTMQQPQPKMDPIPNPAEPAYFIQAGSFSEIANAQRLSGDLNGSLPVGRCYGECEWR